MYERFFFLKEKPFHITPDPRFLYLSQNHREAIDLITYGIRERKGFMLLAGEVGTGKTTVCRAILESLPPATGSALILNPLLSGAELLKTITGDLGLDVRDEGAKAHMDALNAYLLRLASSASTAVVIIDEAQHLSPEALEMVRLLSNLETEREKLLQIVLAGQPELKEILSRHMLRQLNQRITIRHTLEPLEHGETRAYIEKRLSVAGGKGAVEFTREALERVYSGSGGIPRLINIICDRALTAAFIDEKRTIDSGILGRALGELFSEGSIRTAPEPPAYSGIAPYLVGTAFLTAFVAGILWGPAILSLASN